jgi:hypothetical protein
MKRLPIFAALVAMTAVASVHAETMPKIHAAGGPIKQNHSCWVSTDNIGHGWWDECDTQSPGRARFLRDIQDTDLLAGGGGGGAGGGGNR